MKGRANIEPSAMSVDPASKSLRMDPRRYRENSLTAR